jgi:hypothetical protein
VADLDARDVGDGTRTGRGRGGWRKWHGHDYPTRFRAFEDLPIQLAQHKNSCATNDVNWVFLKN